MSVAYQAVGWNPLKLRYDAVLGACLTLYLALFVGGGAAVDPNATIETLLIRGLGTAAFGLLTVILCIGPLCRLDRRFLPLLYNRRHLGVTMFVVALAHGAFALVQFHALGDTNPLVSVLVANPRLDSVPQFPFELLGIAALVILFLMAATSHDFWLANLTPPFWKALHMLVYAAYALVVLHVALGALQAERSPVFGLLVLASVLLVLGLHVAAARRERALDEDEGDESTRADGFVDVCAVSDIPDDRARIVTLSGERVAVFRWDGKVSAISNVCRHQNGPLGEGKVIDGCVTCPWHGYQYDPATGRAPKPFTEKVPTFAVRIEGTRVLVHPRPNAPGTPVEPARIGEPGGAHERGTDDLFVGWAGTLPPAEKRIARRAVALLAALAIAFPLTVVLAQSRLAPATFEYGVTRRFRGVLRADPVPVLTGASASRTDQEGTGGEPRPGLGGAGDRDGESVPATLLLVAPGKHGASALARAHDGATVDVAGSLAYRDGRAILELVPDSLVVHDRAAGTEPVVSRGEGTGPVVSLGELRLAGEIVDSKCHLGVMNPGDGKTHRGCAARCISGGVPPALRVRDLDGHQQLVLLVGPRGESIGAALLPFVAEPVEIRGRGERRGDLLVLYADPADVRRLGEEG